MKKKFLYGFAVLAIATMVAFNVNMNSKGSRLSDVSLANVEALAGGEGDDSFWCCGWTGFCTWEQGGEFRVTPCN